MDQPWSVVRQVLVQGFSHLISPAHACYYFTRLHQDRGESLKAYIYRYVIIVNYPLRFGVYFFFWPVLGEYGGNCSNMAGVDMLPLYGGMLGVYRK